MMNEPSLQLSSLLVTIGISHTESTESWSRQRKYSVNRLSTIVFSLITIFSLSFVSIILCKEFLVVVVQILGVSPHALEIVWTGCFIRKGLHLTWLVREIHCASDGEFRRILFVMRQCGITQYSVTRARDTIFTPTLGSTRLCVYFCW